MATTTIKQISNELWATGMTLADIYIETENSVGSYKASLSSVKDKFTEELTGITYDSALGDGITVPDSVGGIASGTTVGNLTGKTFSDLFDDLLFPTINPTFIAPYSTFGQPYPAIQEVGTVISSILFTIGFNRGQIQLDGIFSNYRAGLAVVPDGYNYTGTEMISLTSSTTQTITGYTIVVGSQSWTGSVNYSVGPDAFNNKGVWYASGLTSGTTTPVTTTIEGVYPLYATTVNLSTLTKQSLISMSTNPAPNSIDAGGLILVGGSSGIYQKFDVPTAWAGGGGVTGIKNWDTFSNSWVYEGGSASSSLAVWTLTSTSDHAPISYTRFEYNQGDRGAMSIYLEF